MYGTYLRLDITVYDSWRAVVRAAQKHFYRAMLDFHRHAQELVRAWRL
jgi:hypothetical protein